MLTLHGIHRWDHDETVDVLVDDAHGPACLTDGPAITNGDVDAGDYVLAPGLTDPHVHWRDPGQTQKESMVSGAAAATSGGYTRVLLMPNTMPALDGRTPRPDDPGADEVLGAGCVDAIDYLQRYEDMLGRRLPVHYDLSVCASISRAGRQASNPSDWMRYMATSDIHDESMVTAHIRSEHPVTFISDDGSAVTDGILDKVLDNASQTGLTLLEHCEHHDHGVMNEGSVSRRLGLPGIPETTELAIVNRDIEACRNTGVPIHFQHVSTASAFDAVRKAKADGLPITCETAPHYLALCDEDVQRYGTMAKMNPPLRSSRDRKATLEAVADGTVDMIATDHAPHTRAEKNAGFLEAPNGVIGLETAYAICRHALVEGGYIDDHRLIELMATAPTRFMGYRPSDIEPLLETRPDRPRRILDLRRVAARDDRTSIDLVVLAPQEHWTVDPDRFLSKARNTPFRGWRVSGRPMATILDAQLVFSRMPPAISQETISQGA